MSEKSLNQQIIDHLKGKEGLTMTDIATAFKSHGREAVGETISSLVKAGDLQVKEVRGVRYYFIPQQGQQTHEHKYKNIRRN